MVALSTSLFPLICDLGKLIIVLCLGFLRKPNILQLQEYWGWKRMLRQSHKAPILLLLQLSDGIGFGFGVGMDLGWELGLVLGGGSQILVLPRASPPRFFFWQSHGILEHPWYILGTHTVHTGYIHGTHTVHTWYIHAGVCMICIRKWCSKMGTLLALFCLLIEVNQYTVSWKDWKFDSKMQCAPNQNLSRNANRVNWRNKRASLVLHQ